jgi:hypothetical protein
VRGRTVLCPREREGKGTLSSARAAAPSRPDKIRNLRYLLVRDRALRLAEHAIGGWASTLRAALLMMATFVAVVVLVGIVLGFEGALAGAVVSGIALYRVGRSTAPAG